MAIAFATVGTHKLMHCLDCAKASTLLLRRGI
jgi:hypothetical protein